MCWVYGGILCGMEYMGELSYVQLWQISIAGSLRNSCHSPTRKSSVCTPWCTVVGWLGMDLRTALDMSPASPTESYRKPQAGAASCRSRTVVRCTFLSLTYLPRVDIHCFRFLYCIWATESPLKWMDDFMRPECFCAHTVAATLDEGACTPVMCPVTQNTIVGVSVGSERVNSFGLYYHKVHYVLEWRKETADFVIFYPPGLIYPEHSWAPRTYKK